MLNIEELLHTWLAESKLAREMEQAEKMSALRQGYGATVYAIV